MYIDILHNLTLLMLTFSDRLDHRIILYFKKKFTFLWYHVLYHFKRLKISIHFFYTFFKILFEFSIFSTSECFWWRDSFFSPIEKQMWYFSSRPYYYLNHLVSSHLLFECYLHSFTSIVRQGRLKIYREREL